MVLGLYACAPNRPRFHGDFDQPDTPAETVAQINDLFDLAELIQAIKSEEFRQFLDHIPIAIVISKLVRGDQRICYANEAFKKLTGRTLADFGGRGWSILDAFKDETDPKITLAAAMIKGSGDFLGTFRSEEPKPLVVEAFSGLIEDEDGIENYRIAALIDVTDRARAEREEFARQIRDKDTVAEGSAAPRQKQSPTHRRPGPARSKGRKKGRQDQSGGARRPN